MTLPDRHMRYVPAFQFHEMLRKFVHLYAERPCCLIKCIVHLKRHLMQLRATV